MFELLILLIFAPLFLGLCYSVIGFKNPLKIYGDIFANANKYSASESLIHSFSVAFSLAATVIASFLLFNSQNVIDFVLFAGFLLAGLVFESVATKEFDLRNKFIIPAFVIGMFGIYLFADVSPLEGILNLFHTDFWMCFCTCFMLVFLMAASVNELSSKGLDRAFLLYSSALRFSLFAAIHAMIFASGNIWLFLAIMLIGSLIAGGLRNFGCKAVSFAALVFAIAVAGVAIGLH